MIRGKAKAKKGKVGRQASSKEEVEAKVKQTLTEDELQELREIFDLFDEDHSGKVDSSEITKAIENLDLKSRNPVIFEVISALQDIEGELDFELFIEVVCDKLGNTQSRQGVARLFDLYDLDNSGLVGFPQMKRVARELGETMNDEELAEMMHHVHVLSKTGKVEGGFTQEEFYNIVTKNKLF